MNTKPLQGKDYSRHDLFVKDEKPHLSPMPSSVFEIKKSTRGKVQRNYHVILGEDKHQYSVAYQHVGKTTDIIYTSKTVEIYLSTQRIAIHKRDRRKHAYSHYPYTCQKSISSIWNKKDGMLPILKTSHTHRTLYPVGYNLATGKQTMDRTDL